MKAIQAYNVIEVEYLAKSNTETKLHAFIPVRIVAYQDGLYIKAWKVNEKGKVELLKPITFALQRIKQLWITNRAMPEEEFLKNPLPQETSNKLFGMTTQADPFEVQIKFYPPASSIIHEKIWSSDQIFKEQEDGSMLLTMSSQSEYEVIKWVLSYGEDAELIAPAHLREKVKKELQSSLMRY